MHFPCDRNLGIHVPSHWDRLFVDAAVLVILNHTHNRHLISAVGGSNAVAERILIGQKAFREQLINDACMRRGSSVGIGKVAAGKYGHSQCMKEIWTYYVAAHPGGSV